ncbi:MAG: DUF2889 domain-containing protein [Candidatus Puniceispirillaceae bacterium]
MTIKTKAGTKPATRTHSHRRTITLDGFAREDGHYDIEAELIDTKSYSFPSRTHGTVEKGEPLHHMKICVTISEEMMILDASAKTLSGPYHDCPQGAAAIGNLIGETIRPGWKKIVARAIGGKQGCTHITELMGPVATVAFQTIFGERAKRNREASQTNEGATSEKTPQMTGLLNSCFALSEGRQAAIWHWGDTDKDIDKDNDSTSS